MLKRLLAMGQMLRSAPFARSVFSLQIGSVFATGIGFLKSVAYAKLLGVQGFGEYAVVLALVGTVSVIANVGQNQATLTFFAEEYSKKNKEGMRGVVRYYWILAAMSSIILAILALGSGLLTSVFYGSDAFTVPVRIAFIALLAGTPHTIVIIMLQTVGEVVRMTFLENINLLLQFLAAVCLLLLGWGIMGIFAGLLFSNVLMLLVYAWTYKRLRRQYALPSLLASIRSHTSIWPFIKQGGWIALDKNLGNLFPQGFLFIMSLFAPASTVGFAQLAYKIGALPSTLFLPHVVRMATTTLPALREKGLKALQRGCLRIARYSLAFHGLTSVTSMIVLPFLVILFYGRDFAPVIAPMLWIIVILISGAIGISNSPLYRLYRQAHIPALWNIVSFPILFIAFAVMVQSMDPLTAFVIIIAVTLGLHQWLTWYLHAVLIPTHTHAHSPHQ